MKKNFFLLCWMVLLAPSRVANAGIHFDKEEVTTTVKLDTLSVDVKFLFKNDGKEPLIIKNLKTSCGCTVAQSDKKIYLPGESGEVSATMNITGAQGQLDKSIIVETNEADHAATKLTAHIVIPGLVSFSPNAYVRWDQGGDAKPQTVKVRVDAPFPMRITNIKSWHDKVHATLKELTPGKEYEITVWPTDTKDVLNNAIELLNDAKPEKKIWLLVHVKPKGES